jgi:hypothetical protein
MLPFHQPNDAPGPELTTLQSRVFGFSWMEAILKSVEGIYRNGKVELTEQPGDLRDDTLVIVTFLDRPVIDLRALGIDARQAAELRVSLDRFAQDWNSPEMDEYDDYDAARAGLSSG